MVSNRQLNNRKSGPQENAVDDHLAVVGISIGLVVGGVVVATVGGSVGGSVGVIVAVVVAVVVATVVSNVLADRRTSERRQRRKGAVALRLVTWLLPSEARQDYAEEWRRWLSDLRKAGEPRYRRLIELLTILLIAAPRLAVILRLGRRRAVD